MPTEQLITRFAPSPTGFLHIGNYRTAVFAYLAARHSEGTFILRIEDTDRARSKSEYADNIIETLEWLGLEYDYQHRQSEWVGEHETVLRLLVERGQAYVSKEANEAGVEREVIRFRNPNKEVTFTDIVRGPITMNTTDLGDFVIAKSFTEPLFHLVVVVDDALMGVNRIVRGEDHISNTPRQLLLYEALGATIPTYAHLPLVLAPDRSKLSKRNGAKALLDYRTEGYLPEALLNYLAMLGWHPGSDEEFFTKEHLIERFDIGQVQKSGAIFDETKLRWFNREHMGRIPDTLFAEEIKKWLSAELVSLLEEEGRFDALIPTLRERISTYGDIAAMEKEGDLQYFVMQPEYEKEKVLWHKEPDAVLTKKRLETLSGLLESIDEKKWDSASVKSAVWKFAEQEGKGSVLWPFRFALTGREKSPDPFEVAGILGRNETLSRITVAISKLA